MSSADNSTNLYTKKFLSKHKTLLIFAIGITILNAIIFSTLTNMELQQPKPLPDNVLKQEIQMDTKILQEMPDCQYFDNKGIWMGCLSIAESPERDALNP